MRVPKFRIIRVPFKEGVKRIVTEKNFLGSLNPKSRKLWSYREFMVKRNNFHHRFSKAYPKGGLKSGTVWKEFEKRNRDIVNELEGLTETLDGFTAEESKVPFPRGGTEEAIRDYSEKIGEIESRKDAFVKESGYYGKLYGAYRKLMKFGAKNRDLVN